MNYSDPYRYTSTSPVVEKDDDATTVANPYGQAKSYPTPSRKARTSYGQSIQPSTTSHRDRIRGVSHMRYYNGFLTQSRLNQVFGMDYDDEADDAYEVSPVEVGGYVYESQMSLNLETVDQVENKFAYMMKKYEQAINVLGAHALLWHDLMEDLDNNPHLLEEFRKFQMLRKLSGGTL